MRLWDLFILMVLGIFLPIIFIIFYIGTDIGLKYVEQEQRDVVRKAYEDGTVNSIECKGFYFNDKLYMYIPSEDELHMVNTSSR